MLRRYVYTTGVDGMVCQIDTSTGSILGRFRAFTKPISSMSVSAGKQGFPYRVVRPRTARYIRVRQLTGTWTGRYRAVPLKSAVGGRLKKKKGKEEEEKKKEEVLGRRPRLRAARAPSSSTGRSRAVTA
ncbi:hypothetical protein BHM03_00019082, partial [Ensete ventricosum]